MQINDKRNSANIALWYKDITFSLDELMGQQGNVTKECWQYLVGKYSKAERDRCSGDERQSSIYNRLGEKFGYTGSNIRRVINYSAAIDHIRKYLPNVADDILNGVIQIPSAETRALLKMKPHEIIHIIKRLSNEKILAREIIREQKSLRKMPKRRGRPRKITNDIPRISIKDTPSHDPDAQTNALVYTVPSWVEIIERAFDTSDFDSISLVAKNKLSAELEKLSSSVEALRALLQEVHT